MSDKQAFLASKAAYGSAADRTRIASESGLVYDPSASGKQVATYVNPATKQVVVAHRGTATKHDIVTDAALALGLQRYTPRFRKAQKKTKDIQKKYEGYEVTHTGHSLGGAIAMEQGKRSGGRVVAFNRGAGLTSIGGRRAKNQTDYVNKRDLVSTMTRFELPARKSVARTVQISGGGRGVVGAHTIENKAMGRLFST